MLRKLSIIPIIIFGKVLQFLLKLVKRSGGSAFPGLIVEKVSPKFLNKMLDNLKYGVVLVSGTNGKTTTTHMISDLLKSQGLRVFTNKSGSNFIRGVISSILKQSSIFGSLKADVAVLELDEAHAVHFVKLVKPRVSLILNVMRDQLDRFGEIDQTAELLSKIVEETSETVILNKNDNRVYALKEYAKNSDVEFFGYSQNLKNLFINDDELKSLEVDSNQETANRFDSWAGNWKLEDSENIGSNKEVILESLEEIEAIQRLKLSINKYPYETDIQIKGAHNALNLVAAISAVQAIMKNKFDAKRFFEAAKTIESAFGRGEIIEYQNKSVQLVLVKNPAGFQIALKSYETDNSNLLIAINDNYADSRDVSWLWDVNFDLLKKSDRNIFISGMRAFDLELRLMYLGIKTNYSNLSIVETLKKALLEINPNEKIRIYATYTCMLEIRSILKKKAIEQ